MHDVSIFLVILTICATVCVLRALRLKYRRDPRMDKDDARTMQEINRGLLRMEDRIDALETLLMDHHERKQSRQRIE